MIYHIDAPTSVEPSNRSSPESGPVHPDDSRLQEIPPDLRGIRVEVSTRWRTSTIEAYMVRNPNSSFIARGAARPPLSHCRHPIEDERRFLGACS